MCLCYTGCIGCYSCWREQHEHEHEHHEQSAPGRQSHCEELGRAFERVANGVFSQHLTDDRFFHQLLAPHFQLSQWSWWVSGPALTPMTPTPTPMAPAMTPATFKNFTFSLVFSLHVFGYASCIHTLDAVLCSSIFGKLSLVGAILKCAAKKDNTWLSAKCFVGNLDLQHLRHFKSSSNFVTFKIGSLHGPRATHFWSSEHLLSNTPESFNQLWRHDVSGVVMVNSSARNAWHMCHMCHIMHPWSHWSHWFSLKQSHGAWLAPPLPGPSGTEGCTVLDSAQCGVLRHFWTRSPTKHPLQCFRCFVRHFQQQFRANPRKNTIYTVAAVAKTLSPRRFNLQSGA